MWGDIVSGIGSIVGGIMGRDSAEDMATRQMQMQKKFAQEGIQWRVEDAKKAGVHPLYALGAQTTSYSPVAMNDPLPAAISEASSSVGRAINSTASAPERALNLQIMQENLRGAKLKNDLVAADVIASQNKLLTQPGTGKPFPALTQLPHDATPDAVPRMLIGGKEIYANPWWMNADVGQKRWGEGSDYVVGPAVAMADYGFNIAQSMREGQRARPRDLVRYMRDWYGGFKRDWERWERR